MFCRQKLSHVAKLQSQLIKFLGFQRAYLYLVVKEADNLNSAHVLTKNVLDYIVNDLDPIHLFEVYILFIEIIYS